MRQIYEFILFAPSTFLMERRYAADVVFREFLGINVTLKVEDRENWCLLDREKKAKLYLPDCFFKNYKRLWLKKESMPLLPLNILHSERILPEAVLVEPDLPILFGERTKDGSWFQVENERTARLGVDVLGAAFFMLTRYEELVVNERDEHGRFPGYASLAYRAGFLDRPIIDEYVELLWAVIKRLWPNVGRKKRSFRVCPTHDVDSPFAHQSLGRLGSIRASFGDFLKRGAPKLAIRRAISALLPPKLQDAVDPNNTFNWIMDLSERYGLKSTFYFMAGGAPPYHPLYALDEPRIRRLIRSIHRRGHEIGLHGSYDAMEKPSMIAAERQKIDYVLREEGIWQSGLGGRQHYLRWSADSTWRAYDEAGLTYDSSLGYADIPGYRTGTSLEYPVFDLINRKVLNLYERPLIFMEASLLSKQYGNLDREDALNKIKDLIKATRRVQGTFTFLWHNSFLQYAFLRKIYKQCLEACS